MSADADRVHLARAIRLALRGLNTCDPNPRVGCVLVRDGAIVGEGWHARAGGPHAEVVALAQAGTEARGATAYVSLEPCCHHGRTPPCTEALIAAGVVRVVYATRDPNPRVDGGGERQLRAAGIAVEGGLLEREAAALNPGFFLRMTRGRPLVRTKLAVSLDGRTALADGRSRWITGEDARHDVQRWRARSSAVMTGIGTVLADDPGLDVREGDSAGVRPPLRVILDSNLRTPPEARILRVGGPALVFAVRDDAERRGALEAAGARVEIVAATPDRRIDLPAAVHRLGELGVNELWVEAGEQVNGGLIQTGLVDELVIYLASHVLGSTARGMFALPPLPDMAARPTFRLAGARPVGDDLRLVYARTGS